MVPSQQWGGGAGLGLLTPHPGDEGPRTRLDAETPCLGPPGCGCCGQAVLDKPAFHPVQEASPSPPGDASSGGHVGSAGRGGGVGETQAAEALEGVGGGELGHPQALSPQ